MKMFDGLLITLGMYTIVPVPQRSWTERGMRWTMVWLPFVGLIISGGWLLLLWLYISGVIGSFVAAAFLTLWPIVVTGGLHMDGLADAADAIGSRRDRETRLRIMKEPTSGPSAIIWTSAVLLAQTMAWLELLNLRFISSIDSVINHDLGWIILLLIPFVSRILAGLGVTILSPARSNGLVKTFRDVLAPAVLPLLILIAALTAAGCLLLNIYVGLITVIAAFICFVSWLIMCRRSFGGVTGDLAGFLIVVSETLLLIVLAVFMFIAEKTGGLV